MACPTRTSIKCQQINNNQLQPIIIVVPCCCPYEKLLPVVVGKKIVCYLYVCMVLNVSFNPTMQGGRINIKPIIHYTGCVYNGDTRYTDFHADMLAWCIWFRMSCDIQFPIVPLEFWCKRENILKDLSHMQSKIIIETRDNCMVGKYLEVMSKHH